MVESSVQGAEPFAEWLDSHVAPVSARISRPAAISGRSWTASSNSLRGLIAVFFSTEPELRISINPKSSLSPTCRASCSRRCVTVRTAFA